MKNQTARAPRGAPVIMAAFAAFTFSLLAGCERADSQSQGMSPAEVSVVTVQAQDVPAVYEYTGETAGSREVEVRARVKGILQTRNYLEGGHVDAGQSLFTIDQAPYQAALEKAQADVTSARAELDKARRNAERFKPLHQEKAISQKDYEDVLSNQVIAEANLKSAQARLTQAKLDLEYTRVEAPITGTAGRALRSEGNYVTGPEVLLTTVTQSDPIYVLFGISDEERRELNRESAAGRLVLPQDGAYAVTVKLAEGHEYTRAGKLTFTDVRISDTTGTSQARAELPNPDGQLRPGQFVRVILKGAYRPAAILVPQRAVLEGPTGKFVYVVDAESKAQSRPVQVGDWVEDKWIINDGLKAGDKVIVDGVMKIGPGSAVHVATPAESKPGAAPANKATSS
ncbi:MAG: efflux RND transporter periplasmic adaptor subunit [Gammaproteobacteria bacterium]|nr:efflux RND transporter periplasmic adaptor subunit [Gammaproteobacteria bacterium]